MMARCMHWCDIPVMCVLHVCVHVQRSGVLHVADIVLTNDTFALEVGIKFYSYIEANKTLRVPNFQLEYYNGEKGWF